jgi:hypothetical protein
VNKIERLERRLDILEFIAISEALGIEASRLLGDIRQTLPRTVQV